ncbi:MAG TPA: hypothetical protein EYH50_03665 [Pyrodictium delaneyi]|uniref:Uncharacterized protein n=1 Tax=Pyrodictium delaneyi TaxID=1273541 RepID=A0A832ZTH1_9CREN|nr:hypothetical protein [Pyrodictium delaneyi]
MAWRNIMASIFEAAINHVESTCARDGSEPIACARALVAAADALYTPLKPVDSGLGEARRVATMLASLVANTFIYMVSKDKDIEFIKSVRSELEGIVNTEKPLEEVEAILEKASATMTPAKLDDAREAVLNEISEYIEPPQPTIPRRRRRQPRRPNPAQNIRRLVRDLGRRDPLLAKQIARLLKAKGIPA